MSETALNQPPGYDTHNVQQDVHDDEHTAAPETPNAIEPATNVTAASVNPPQSDSYPTSPSTMDALAAPADVPPPSTHTELPASELTDRPVDSQVASLHAMFPDFDDAVLQYVLDSVGGDHERAVDALLGMSDPSYVPQEAPARPVPTQTELDEQLARRLMLEDQQAQQHTWQAQPQSRGPVPYDTRQRDRPTRAQEGYANPNAERDTMSDFTEQFNKIAETGKKTFGSIVSKVKAKIQEYDQPSPNRTGQGSYSGGTEPRWGGGSGGQPNQAQRPSYYDPNVPTPPARPVQGYDMAPQPTAVPPSREPPPRTSASSQPTNATASEDVSPTSSLTAETPRPPPTNFGAPASNIDPGKLGLLPKRPISLLGPNSPTVTRSSDDDDDLEYVENPFEDSRR